MTSPRRILVIGKDGRTDAIAAACLAGRSDVELFAFSEMPIPGLVQKCSQVHLGNLRDTSRLLDVVRETRPDLAIIGPEEPLEAGYVDALTRLGIRAFGPTRRLAAIESSKSWARQLLDRHDIPGNPEYRVFDDRGGLRRYIEEIGACVVKPDGLTAGKGVRVLGDHLADADAAIEYAASLLTQDGRVQIEERIDGEEFSLQTITDGETVIHCPVVQDHKRAYEGDTGPNTGGMGSYSDADGSLPFLTPDDIRDARAINERVVEALGTDTGTPYRGVLYGGFIATGDGIRLIEYNARFGDPEAMNVLPLLQGDFVEICSAVTEGRLRDVSCSFAAKATVCKYIVPLDYPAASSTGQEIDVPVRYRDGDAVKWFWAASRQVGDRTVMSSSRAGAVVGVGDTLEQAERSAEQAAEDIRGPVRHRRDIGRPGIIESKRAKVAKLRGWVEAAAS